MKTADEKSMPFLQHLEEFRRALIKSLAAVFLATALCLGFSPQIFRVLQKPLLEALPRGSYFIATTPFETYLAYFKVSLGSGLFFASPFIFYFLWSFIRPGLNRTEKKTALLSAMICGLLFMGGACFGYWVVFPAGFRFIVELLQGTQIVLLPKISDYLSISLRLLLAFGIVFELPLFLFLLGRFGLVDADRLRRARKFVIVAIFLLAGLLTPGPDVLSQLLMAVPLLLLFEAGILLVKIWGRKPGVIKPAASPEGATTS